MPPTAEAYARLEARFVAWAATVPNIRAAVVIGSRARTVNPADEWADLDILFITSEPGRYIAAADWLANMGDYWLTFVETTPDGEQERRVLFEGGLDVDFVPLPVERMAQLEESIRAGEVPDPIRRGARVLLDKDGAVTAALARLSSLARPARQEPPAEERFLNVVNDFWYHTVWAAKKLRRGELWTAKGCVDSYLKWGCLLPMIEWHARAAHGWDYETWLRGRFLERWADPRAIDGLRGAFGRYEADDLWRALFATMDLFRWLATETATRLGYSCPDEAETKTVALVRELFAGR